MAQREINPEEAESFGRSVCERKVCPTLKGTQEPIGYFLSVDLDTEDWELDESHIRAARRLMARRLDADVYTFRVGYSAA